ncbi:hypothetical protein ACYULU_02760 [Breznakiellaceae bacterium SP9]
MKHRAAVFVVLWSMFLFACGSTQVTLIESEDSPFNEVVRITVSTIENKLATTEAAKKTVAVLNFSSEAEELSRYVVGSLANLLVQNDVVTVLDRDRDTLALITKEQDFQLSGAVSDESAVSIGKQLGAQYIVTGAFTSIGADYQFSVKTIAVETGVIAASSLLFVRTDAKVQALLGGKREAPLAVTPTIATVTGVTGTASNAATVDGTLITFADLDNIVPKNGSKYVIMLDSDMNLSPTILNFDNRRVRITICSRNTVRTLSLVGQGSLFTVQNGVTLVLENITLKGIKDNAKALVMVEKGGTLLLNDGGSISGNSSVYGGGVYSSGTFAMSGGSISGNSSGEGGGVYSSGTFAMSGGTISGNSSGSGGGVYISSSILTMSGGSISGNSSGNGGGVSIASGTLTMSGGIIGGNGAGYGGGVYIGGGGIIKKSSTGGIIYGANNLDATLKNSAIGNGDAVAVYVDYEDYRKNSSKSRNSTVGAGMSLDSTKDGKAGGWEYWE